MPNREEIRWGKELAKEGADHIVFIQTLPDKEYEFDHPPTDEDVFLSMKLDLAAHKLTCGGCGKDMLEEAKRKVKELKSKIA